MRLRAETREQRDEWVAVLQNIRGRRDALMRLEQEQEEKEEGRASVAPLVTLNSDAGAGMEQPDDWEFMPDMAEVVAPRAETSGIEHSFVVTAERNRMFVVTCIETARETGEVLNTYTTNATMTAMATHHRQLLELAPQMTQALAEVPWRTTMFGKVVGVGKTPADNANRLVTYFHHVMT